MHARCLTVRKGRSVANILSANRLTPEPIEDLTVYPCAGPAQRSRNFVRRKEGNEPALKLIYFAAGTDRPVFDDVNPRILTIET